MITTRYPPLACVCVTCLSLNLLSFTFSAHGSAQLYIFDIPHKQVLVTPSRPAHRVPATRLARPPRSRVTSLVLDGFWYLVCLRRLTLFIVPLITPSTDQMITLTFLVHLFRYPGLFIVCGSLAAGTDISAYFDISRLIYERDDSNDLPVDGHVVKRKK